MSEIVIEEKPKGIVRGCLPVLIGVVVLIAGAVGWVALRMGGVEGLKRETFVVGSINATERHVLTLRPDGIAEDEVTARFERLRVAVRDDRVDLNALYDAIRRYQRQYKGTKKRPSDAEMRAILDTLDETILPSLSGDER